MLPGDKWQSKTLFLEIFDLHSLIVKSIFDKHLPDVNTAHITVGNVSAVQVLGGKASIAHIIGGKGNTVNTIGSLSSGPYFSYFSLLLQYLEVF